jgi:hypothetical protein
LGILIPKGGSQHRKGYQCQHQTAQKKNEEIFKPDLSGTNHQCTPQQLHGGPVCTPAMALV